MYKLPKDKTNLVLVLVLSPDTMPPRLACFLPGISSGSFSPSHEPFSRPNVAGCTYLEKSDVSYLTTRALKDLDNLFNTRPFHILYTLPSLRTCRYGFLLRHCRPTSRLPLRMRSFLALHAHMRSWPWFTGAFSIA